MAGVRQHNQNDFPVITDPRKFDESTGGILERFVFNNRALLLLGFFALTLFLGKHALDLKINASFDRMIPTGHSYIKNFLENRDELKGLGNTIRIVVEAKQGDVFDPEYLETLRKVNDAVSTLRGVDRPWVKSLWSPTVRWSEVTEIGYDSGPLMPDRFDGSPQAIDALRVNIARAGVVGQLVASNYQSSAIVAPLLDVYPDNKEDLDYFKLSRELEANVRSLGNEHVNIRIIGFAKVAGDLIEGLWQVMSYFAISVLIASLFVFLFTRCVRSTLLLVSVSLLGVVWLLGVMKLLGFVLDPFSILVPFLVFAIGLSHGAQKMNGIMQDIGRGTHRYVAARYTFRRLFLAGLTALLANVVGFAVLMLIDIPVIRDLAFATSIGVSILILTKLILIPVALSYVGVDRRAAVRSIQKDTNLSEVGLMASFWNFFSSFTVRPRATAAVMIGLTVGVIAFAVSFQVKIGDLDAGAPELRPDSRYNQDNAYINANYGMSSDQFAVIVKTEEGGCAAYETLLETGRLAWALEHVPGVQATSSFYDQVVRGLQGTNEGNPKWASLYNQSNAVGTAVQRISADNPGAFNTKCSVAPLVAYLSDHKADTLSRVLDEVEAFAAEHNQPGLQFLPAAGTAGIQAVTNIVVRKANVKILAVLYVVTAVLCFITFRSWRAVVVAMVPLIITSFLAESIMVWLDIGIKVSTLPVIALGVGVGIDYALYLLNVQLGHQRAGYSLSQSYRSALMFTGRVVALIGVTMAAGVATWVWSPIKFQADMGILLTFMFLWNMLGALILIPALSHFLLNDKYFIKRAAVSAPAAGTVRSSLPEGETCSLTNT